MHSCYFRALRLGGVLTSPQAAPSGLQMTPPSLPGTENPGMPGSPDFILILHGLNRPFKKSYHCKVSAHRPSGEKKLLLRTYIKANFEVKVFRFVWAIPLEASKTLCSHRFSIQNVLSQSDYKNIMDCRSSGCSRMTSIIYFTICILSPSVKLAIDFQSFLSVYEYEVD